MVRRCRLEIDADILSIAQGGARKTAIVYKANLNFKIVKGYLARLLQTERLRQEGKFYHTTPQGLDFILHVEALRSPLKCQL